MGERGVVGIDRDVFEHELLKGEPYTKVQAWVWLIAEASWKSRRVRVAGSWLELERGQLAHSLRHMARTWRWSLKRVRGLLARLADDGMVAIGHSEGHSVKIITLCNYNSYQAVVVVKGTAKGTGGAQEGHNTKKGDTDSAAAGDAIMRARATELTSQIYDIFGFDPLFIPPAWMGAQYWIEAGLRGGWKPDIVRLAVRKVAARKKAAPNNFRYLGPAIVEEHERACAPMPHGQGETNARSQRNLTLLRPFEGDRTVAKSVDRVIAKLRRAEN